MSDLLAASITEAANGIAGLVAVVSGIAAGIARLLVVAGWKVSFCLC